MSRLALAFSIAIAAIISPPATQLSAQTAARGGPAAAAAPLLTLATVKGDIQIRLFQSDAPKSVEHILDLVRRNFYRAQRFHRVESSLIQFGDRTTRDMSMRADWGRGNSGNQIGVSEINRHKHVRGAVSLANYDDPKTADSQIFIMKTASPSLDGKYVVIGQVTSGMNVVDSIKVTDLIKNLTLTAAVPK